MRLVRYVPGCSAVACSRAEPACGSLIPMAGGAVQVPRQAGFCGVELSCDDKQGPRKACRMWLGWRAVWFGARAAELCAEAWLGAWQLAANFCPLHTTQPRAHASPGSGKRVWDTRACGSGMRVRNRAASRAAMAASVVSPGPSPSCPPGSGRPPAPWAASSASRASRRARSRSTTRRARARSEVRFGCGADLLHVLRAVNSWRKSHALSCGCRPAQVVASAPVAKKP
jgi:hypothetical protein